MKKYGLLAAGAILLASTLPSVAVDNLAIRPDGTSIVLSWPSNPGQTYVILFTTNLNSPIQWQILASELPAADGTNRTTFVHYDQIPLSSGGGGTGGTNGGGGPPQPMRSMRLANTQPMVLQKDQTMVPLQLFPPGFDLSDTMFYNPVSQDWLKGSVVPQFSAAVSAETLDAAEQQGPSCGFYRVLGAQVLGGLANGMTLTDLVTVTAKAENNVKYLRLLVNGQVIPGQSAIFPPFTDTMTFADVDTARLANGGPYTIQVDAVYEINPESGGGVFHCLSQPFQVNVSNEISFPDWDEMTEDEVCNFDIQSAHQSIDWEIDIFNYYDYLDWYYGNTEELNPIHIKTGSSADGIIKYDWNLVDDWGNARTNENYDPYFVSFTFTWWSSSASPLGTRTASAAAGSGSGAAMNPPKRQPAKWPEQGHWVVAWEDMFRHYYDKNNKLKNSFNLILAMANLEDTPPFWQAPVGGTNAQTFPLRYEYKYRTDLNPTGYNLEDAIIQDEVLLCRMILDPRARNFFYSGHGGPEEFASIPVEFFDDLVKHRYRFVWIDGCKTANGSLSEVFGIKGPGVFSIGYYKERTKRPALFVGNKYNVPIGIPKSDYKVGGVEYSGDIPPTRGEFYTQFAFFWQLMGYSYSRSIEEAQNLVKGAYPDDIMYYLSGPKKDQQYWPGDDQIRIGYEEMGYNSYNLRNDIPRP